MVSNPRGHRRSSGPAQRPPPLPLPLPPAAVAKHLAAMSRPSSGGGTASMTGAPHSLPQQEAATATLAETGAARLVSAANPAITVLSVFPTTLWENSLHRCLPGALSGHTVRHLSKKKCKMACPLEIYAEDEPWMQMGSVSRAVTACLPGVGIGIGQWWPPLPVFDKISPSVGSTCCGS